MGDTPTAARISVLRASRLLIGLGWRRAANKLQSEYGLARSGSRSGERSASGAKHKGSLLTLALPLSAFAFNTYVFHRLIAELGTHQLVPVLSLLAGILWLSLVLAQLGAARLAGGGLEAELSMLLSLPVSLRALLIAKAAELGVMGLGGWSVTLSLFSTIYWHVGFGLMAPVVAGLSALSIFCVLAVWALLAQAGVSLLPRGVGGTIQVVGGLLGGLGVLFVVGTAGVVALVAGYRFSWFSWATGLPVLPLTQPVRFTLLTLEHGRSWLSAVSRHAVELVILFGVGVWWLERVSERALYGESGHSLRGRRSAVRRARRSVGMAGKELTRIARNPLVVIATLILPALTLGQFSLLNGMLPESTVSSPGYLAGGAFACGAALLCAPSLGILGTEGEGLWLLFTVPRSLPRLVLEKGLVWLAPAVVCTLLALGYAVHRLGGISAELAAAGSYALLGVVVYAFVAIAIGATAVDPTRSGGTGSRQAIKFYHSFLLAAVYAYGFSLASQPARLSLLILYAAAALALWQNARRELEYLLDPVAYPAPALTLSDGLLAALGFFVLQSAIVSFASSPGEAPTWRDLALGFTLAGSVVVVVTLLLLRRKLKPLLPAIGLHWGAAPGRAVRAGLVWGVPVIGIALAWAALLRGSPWLWDVARRYGAGRPELSGAEDFWWLAAIMLVAAPVCEEILFRGIVHSGLRNSLGVRASILASSLVFAAVHPFPSTLPVFAMGACAAAAYERSRSLVSPMIVHVAYNATWAWLVAH